MRWLLVLLAVALAGSVTRAAEPEGAGELLVLAYHDVRDEPREAPDRYTTSTRNLAEHFAWLRQNGYSVVSVDQLLAARAGKRPLPAKAVMLTFDDGYRSVYTRVFPLLKAFNYPAVVAVVGSWLEVPEAGLVPYDERALPRSDFVHWNELREMALSGLVEVASHTYDLHRGIAGNPQGDALPAAIARTYSAGRYEADAAYTGRIRDDLRRNSELIRRELGRAPRAIVWPYGRYNAATVAIARELGMSLGFTLQPGANTPTTPADALKRELVKYDPDVSELAAVFTPARPQPIRVMHVDLDYVYDADAEQQRRNLGLLLDRVRAAGINTVFLQAFADPDGNGAADALYFPNRHLPVRADLFAHVAWQLHTRAGVNVYAWMPVLAFESVSLPSRVEAAPHPGKGGSGYPRLSPFDPRARAVVNDLYADLGRHAIFQGLLFHDDATLTDFEDSSAAARAVYSGAWGLPADVGHIRADPALMSDWTRRKTRYLTDFTLELAKSARAWQQPIPIARNLYARVALEPRSEEWFAQNVDDFLESYDYTAVMAMPYLDGAKDPLPWVRNLVAEIAKRPRGLERSIFELQSRDWTSGKPIESALIAQKMRELQLGGALNFGYYPDDFLRGHPDLNAIKPFFSLESFPYEAARPR